MTSTTSHPILGLIDSLVGNDFDDFARRLYSYEARILKDALRVLPEVLWAGSWREHELAWVRAEIGEMFVEGVGNAFALRPRLDGMKRRLASAERETIERCEAEFQARFRQGVEARCGSPGEFTTRLRRSLFVKTILVLLLTTRGRPLLAIVHGGGRGRRAPLLEGRGRLRLIE